MSTTPKPPYEVRCDSTIGKGGSIALPADSNVWARAYADALITDNPIGLRIVRFDDEGNIGTVEWLNTRFRVIEAGITSTGGVQHRIHILDLPVDNDDPKGPEDRSLQLQRSEEAYKQLETIHRHVDKTKFPTRAWNWWVIPPGFPTVKIGYWPSEAVIGFQVGDEEFGDTTGVEQVVSVTE